VYASVAAAPPTEAPDTTGIAFTKEQQWQTRGFRIAGATAAPDGAGALIPRAAVLSEDAARVAFVQLSGEHFEKRILTLGSSSGGSVVVRDGIRPGEYVVAGAAAQLRRETLSPADREHGHSH
jgi:multidrug efflux pump subunit AcrA (membrane-fusion protein)